MNISSFTVLIPAHNRPERLKRLLDYYLSFNVKIIVSDSSDTVFPYLDQYKEQISYVSFPKQPLAYKLYQSLDLIKTPYVVMCADDDFIVPRAVDQVVEFLNQHQDYASGQGIYCVYKINGDKTNFYLDYPHMLNEDIDEQTAVGRVQHLMNNYFQYYYAVFRTEVFCAAIQSTVEDQRNTKIVNLNLLEIYLSLYATAWDKHIVLPCFYAAREEAMADSAALITDGLNSIVRQNKYREQYAYFTQTLSSLIATKDGISINKAKRSLRSAIKAYLKGWYSNSLITKVVRRLSKRYTRQYRIMRLDSLSNYIQDLQHIERSLDKYSYIYSQRLK